MAKYPFTEIEARWQADWAQKNIYRAVEDPNVPKEKRAYVLDMFPYPSGAGLHVGHPEGYTATDIYCRYLRMKGYNVLHPMGFDSFGLPAENYALKTGTPPATTTALNIETFRRQIKALGFSYDWEREVATSDADYYKWTQWIFLLLFKKGLAYESDMPINWCPSCKTGLANEEVDNGNCDRCGTKVTRKRIRQWVLKITAYAERLLADLDELDWSPAIKLMQKNWIGKSEGATVCFAVQGGAQEIEVYTTRPDTLFGATYMVLAPEHRLVAAITSEAQKKAVTDYIEASAKKSDLERTDLAKEKSGVFTGAFAINPVTQKEIPIWISDYVLVSYGTGAIMAVPAHDDRDFEFASKFGLPIQVVVSELHSGAALQVTQPSSAAECFVGDGFAINSGFLDGKKTADAKAAMISFLEEKKIGKRTVNYKLRDWLFSRQRYWGEPIPLIHCVSCGIVEVPENELPLLLPPVNSYEPSDTGESPLAKITQWVNTTCPKCGKPAKRETNTMPQWAGSCWYYLRYLDPHNKNEFAAQEKINYWMPVNLYVGGAEHAVLHLLYARFWHKVLFDLGLVNSKEPFMRLVNQGMILGEDNQKMSKSRGNVINPDDIIREYGADTMRMYEMFMGPFEASKPWATAGIIGIARFLERLWTIGEKQITQSEPPLALLKLTHKTIKKVEHDTSNLAFNTAISQMMVLSTELNKQEKIPQKIWEDLLLMLAPYAPHLAEELWHKAGHSDNIVLCKYPSFDEGLAADLKKTIVVQINGKVRDQFITAPNTDVEELKKLALAAPKIVDLLAGKTIVNIFTVPDRLVNIVVK